MSIEALSWALNYQDLPLDKRTNEPASSCAFVLVALANHADPDGRNAFPSNDRMRIYTKLSERAIQYALRRLEDHGTIASTPDAEVRSAYIKDPRKRPQSYDLVAMLRGAKSGVQSPLRGAKSKIDSPDQGCKVGDDFAPEPSLNRPWTSTTNQNLEDPYGSSLATAPDGSADDDQREDTNVDQTLPGLSEAGFQPGSTTRKTRSGTTEVAQNPAVDTQSSARTIMNGERSVARGKTTKPKPPKVVAPDPLFEEFWGIYPRKIKKKVARDAWDTATVTVDPREVINAVIRYAASRRGEDSRYTAYASTWLNQERWNDEPEYVRNGTGSGGDRRGSGHQPWEPPVDQSVYDINPFTGKRVNS